MENFSDYLRYTAGLFTILSPFSAIPIFLSLTSGRSTAQLRAIALTAALTVFSVLGVSIFAGTEILGIMGTSLDAFRVGGGIVLLLMALSMLNAEVSSVQHTSSEAAEAVSRDAIGVVPLGMPLLAGPGSISTTVIEMQRGGGSLIHAFALLGCIAVVCMWVWLCLVLAAPIGRKLGTIGLNIMNRLFGLLLAATAVQIVANGLHGLFPVLAG